MNESDGMAHLLMQDENQQQQIYTKSSEASHVEARTFRMEQWRYHVCKHLPGI